MPSIVYLRVCARHSSNAGIRTKPYGKRAVEGVDGAVTMYCHNSQLLDLTIAVNKTELGTNQGVDGALQLLSSK